MIYEGRYQKYLEKNKVDLKFVWNQTAVKDRELKITAGSQAIEIRIMSALGKPRWTGGHKESTHALRPNAAPVGVGSEQLWKGNYCFSIHSKIFRLCGGPREIFNLPTFSSPNLML